MTDRNSEGVSIELLPLPEPMQVLGDRGKAAAEAWGRANMEPLIAEIERLRAEREVILTVGVKYAGKSGRLEAKVERLEEALRTSDILLAAFVREGDEIADAVRDRTADALRDHDQESGNG